ncbi:hypothetical protein WJX73_003638 [Symbiochloris irregularis]|uniref:Uncharacterized protein n=1 Tax=Symbiochloris irregularis TaxID=706552 RepID=A0AAW1PMJ0_9CHLO
MDVLRLAVHHTQFPGKPSPPSLNELPFSEAVSAARQLPEMTAFARPTPFSPHRFKSFTYNYSGSPVPDMLERMASQRPCAKQGMQPSRMPFDTLESGTRVGKSRSVAQLSILIDKANLPGDPKFEALAPGQVLIIDFHGSGDRYQHKLDQGLDPSVILGMRLAARYLFRWLQDSGTDGPVLRRVLLVGLSLSACKFEAASYTQEPLAMGLLDQQARFDMLEEFLLRGSNIVSPAALRSVLASPEVSLNVCLTLGIPGIVEILAARALATHSGLEGSRNVHQISAEMSKWLGTLSMTDDVSKLGTPHRKACAALVTISGLVLDVMTTRVDRDKTLQDLMVCALLIKVPQSRALKAAQPCLTYPDAASSLLTVPVWLVGVMRSALEQSPMQAWQGLSAEAAVALRMAEALLLSLLHPLDLGVNIQGAWMQEFVFCSILSRFFLEGAGFVKSASDRHCQLGRLFPGAYGAPELLQTVVSVRPLQLAQDDQHSRFFKTGLKNEDLEISKQATTKLPKQGTIAPLRLHAGG